MHKILALALAIGMALLVGGVADATTRDGGTEGAHASGVKYDWWGSDGELTLVAEPGTRYAVYDGFGKGIAEGELESSSSRFVAGNSGVGPDGTILWVVLNNGVLALTDPDWEWN